MLKECNHKRVYGLRDGWTITEIEKKCKNKSTDALRGTWTMIGIAKKKSAKIRGFMH